MEAVNTVDPKSSYHKEKIFLIFFWFFFLSCLHELMDAKLLGVIISHINVSQTTVLYTLNLDSDVCALYPIKTGNNYFVYSVIWLGSGKSS